MAKEILWYSRKSFSILATLAKEVIIDAKY